jgi:predicted GIY-YIG superfamily endonuclease
MRAGGFRGHRPVRLGPGNWACLCGQPLALTCANARFMMSLHRDKLARERDAARRIQAEEKIAQGLRYQRVATDARVGTIYLIHFERPYRHVRHYIGWTMDLQARVARHHRGDGSKLMRAVSAAGIGWQVVATWEGTRRDERRLKARKRAPDICTACRAEKGKPPYAARRFKTRVAKLAVPA